MPPRLFYFDLGNVLLRFDHRVCSRQMAEVAGVPEDRVWQVVFEEGLQEQFERGDLTTPQFYEAFCERTQSHPGREALLHASSAMFDLNVPTIPIVAHLRAAGYRLGILSNTCEPHWEYVHNGRYAVIAKYFDPCILSYRVGAMKPERKIFEAAIQAAGAPPEQLFFVDDRPANVEGAIATGFDAVQFTTPQRLIADLVQRGVRFNL